MSNPTIINPFDMVGYTPPTQARPSPGPPPPSADRDALEAACKALGRPRVARMVREAIADREASLGILGRPDAFSKGLAEAIDKVDRETLDSTP